MISFSFKAALEREKTSAYNSYQSVLGTLQVINEVNQHMDFDGIGEVLKQIADKKYRFVDSIEALYGRENALQ